MVFFDTALPQIKQYHTLNTHKKKQHNFENCSCMQYAPIDFFLAIIIYFHKGQNLVLLRQKL